MRPVPGKEVLCKIRCQRKSEVGSPEKSRKEPSESFATILKVARALGVKLHAEVA